MVKKSSKHLCLDERIIILESIKKNLPLITIAKKLKKDPTTISKEVKRHRHRAIHNQFFKKDGGFTCANYLHCERNDICVVACPGKFCKQCRLVACSLHCPVFKPAVCKRTHRFPYVCNGCESNKSCKLDRYFYDPIKADNNYKHDLIYSRNGIDLTTKELEKLNNIVKSGVSKNQSLYAILRAHTELNISERTLYRYVENGVLQTKNIDLLRKVKMKPRIKRKAIRNINPAFLKDREYKDYLSCLAKNPSIRPVQLDTVIGKRDESAVLVTLVFPICNLMLAYLVSSKTAYQVKLVFDRLQKLLGIEDFRRLFPAILTDRGTEFNNPNLIEKDHEGKTRTKLFYCDSYCSYQKGHIERNHELIRYILKQGQSFKDLTQDKVDLMMSNINSYPRESKNGYTPYEAFEVLYGEKILQKINIIRVPLDDVCLTKDLLK